MIPFLGAGASLCGRPELASWYQSGYLPSAGELADHLADSYAYPQEARELVRVSQYVELVAGDAALYEELHSIFGGTYEPNSLHELLAALPASLRTLGSVQPGQLLITTNYDDSLERAFTAAGEPYDLVYYDTDPNEPGKFVHVRPDGERAAIPRHTDYREFALEERSVILKIHGAVDRGDETADSYVITEDHYIQYLAHRSASELRAYLMARLRSSHFLFLGFGMSDWNVRVFLHLIWGAR